MKNCKVMRFIALEVMHRHESENASFCFGLRHSGNGRTLSKIFCAFSVGLACAEIW
jgi:IS1 family transposase